MRSTPLARVMIPGRSAAALGQTLNAVIRTTLVVFSVAVFALVVGVQNYKPIGLLIIYAFTFSGGAFGFASVILSVVVSYRASQEIAYGYTTLASRNQHVEQLDPATGRTIRAAGEPFLDRETRRQRLSTGFDLSADGHAPFIPADTNNRRSNWQYAAIIISGVGAIIALLVRLGII
jgi:hypothetical protein